jgi:hypothetical protein
MAYEASTFEYSTGYPFQFKHFEVPLQLSLFLLYLDVIAGKGRAFARRLSGS